MGRAAKSTNIVTRRKYSDREKAQALVFIDLHKGNVSEAARLLEIPLSTLESWDNERGINEEVLQLREEQRGPIADRLEQIVHKLIDAMPDKIDAAPLAATATALGISIDKMRLLRGESTSINETRNPLQLAEAAVVLLNSWAERAKLAEGQASDAGGAIIDVQPMLIEGGPPADPDHNMLCIPTDDTNLS